MRTGKNIDEKLSSKIVKIIKDCVNIDSYSLFDLALRRIRDVINAVIPFDINIDQ